LTIDVHRASAAQGCTATELGTCQAEFIANHPQQGGVSIGIGLGSFAVD
jgi:hypothetical protein